MKKRLMTFLLILIMTAGLIPQAAFAADAEADGADAGGQPYERTIMMYVCGSDLEPLSGLASYNLRQILHAGFSKDDQVKFIVMTGGSTQWMLESDYLYDPETGEQQEHIDTEYNQIWEAKGTDAKENPGKLVLLEKEGLHGVKAVDKEEIFYDGERMSNPQILKDFINYCASNYPAEKYDLILWDHGGGPFDGYGMDNNAGGMMSFAKIMDAFSDNDVTKNGGRFDFIDFDACLMGSVEMILAFADYMDYYIASPEQIPGKGENYQGWLDALGVDPDMDTFELGKKIVDDYIAFYDKPYGDGSASEGTLGVIDVKALMNSGFVETLVQLADIMIEQATGPDEEMGEYLYYDELDFYKSCIRYGTNNNYFDLGTMASQLSYDFKELAPSDILDDGTVIDTNRYTETLDILAGILFNQDIIYARGTTGIHSEPLRYRDIYGHENYGEAGSSGMYLYFPGESDSLISDLNKYTKNLRKAAELLPESSKTDKRRDFFDRYIEAVLDYGLIKKTGFGVTEMLDEGTDRSKISYDTLKYYLTGGNEKKNAPADEDYTDWDGWGYYESKWSKTVGSLILIRAGLGNSTLNVTVEEEQAAEDEVKDWLDGVVRQQARENISKTDMSLTPVEEEGGTGYRVKIQNAQKRVVENIRYNLTARIPAVEQYVRDMSETDDEFSMSITDMDEFCSAKIGYVSGELLYETGEGEPVSESSKADYVEWYLEPGGTWYLPPMEESWYTVKDADGYLHVANIRQDKKNDNQLYFYGTYLTENGIETKCQLIFTEDGLKEIRLGTEDGVSYRAISPDNFTGEVEVMPTKPEQVFIDELNVPLSKKTILLTKDTVKTIQIVRTELENIDDLHLGDSASSEPEISRTIVVRDIYGHETEFPVFRPGWNKYKDEWYYADENGLPVKGWLKDGGTWYYMDDDGIMQTGWVKDGGKWYYLSGSGAMVTGWQKIGSVWYYFTGSGAMVTGWQKINNTWYYLSGSGAMVTGWQKIGSVWYYFTGSGAMVTGWQSIGGKWYYFSSGGAMQTGWQKIGSNWYYFGSGGAMQTGWQKIDGKWYYFRSGGAMVTGRQQIDGKWYTFSSGGAMQ